VPKTLSADDARRVAGLNQSIDGLWRAGKFAEAVEPARQAAALCEKVLGLDHWQTADARRRVETLDAIAGLPEAEAMARAALAIKLKALGEANPCIAQIYKNLALALDAQGKPAEAEALHRTALAIRLRELGDAHPDTAASYHNLALALDAQGKPAEAEALHRTALAFQGRAVRRPAPPHGRPVARPAEGRNPAPAGQAAARGEDPEREPGHRSPGRATPSNEPSGQPRQP
jgi:tetratricopeptide (TPR) repeat protein